MKFLILFLFPILIYSQQQTIDIMHNEIHEGEMHSFSDYRTGIAAAGTFALYMLPTNSTSIRIHCTFSVMCSSSGVLSFYEAPHSTNNRTESLNYNRNRNAKLPNYTGYLRFYTNAAITNNGLLLETVPIGQSNVNAQSRDGGNADTHVEWILKTNTGYYLLFTSDFAGTTYGVNVEYYHHSKDVK